jgi:hypothetical protein
MWWGQEILEDEARFMTKRHSGFKAMSATNIVSNEYVKNKSGENGLI